jgi:hypothetical protein
VTSDFGGASVTSGAGLFPPSVYVLPAVPVSQAALRPQPRSTLAQRVADVPGLSRADLRAADAPAIAATLQGLWAAMKNRPVEEIAHGEMHPDGTPRISSQVAVWLVGRISEAYGREKLVKLSGVKDPETLRSLGGLTRLLIGVIVSDTKGTPE